MYSVYNEYFTLLLTQAQNIVGYAMIAAILLMTIHLNSLFLSIASVIQIGLTFPFAYFIYYYIIGIDYYDSLSILIVFVLVGVGCDDIFVMHDAWLQSKHIVGLKKEIQENNSNENYKILKRRMTFSYRRATKAMFVTQITTFFAFLATVVSEIMPISAFGIWASTIVFCDYILVITIYPSLLILHQRYLINGESKCMKYLCFFKQCNCIRNNNNHNDGFRALEQFFGYYWFNFGSATVQQHVAFK